MNKKTLAACAIACSAVLGFSTAAPAMASHSDSRSDHDYTKRVNDDNRRTSYWGDNCTKYRFSDEDDTVRFSHRVYLKTVVVKAGRQLTVFKHFYGRTVYSENERDIDWIIVCKRDRFDDNDDNRNRNRYDDNRENRGNDNDDNRNRSRSDDYRYGGDDD
jgi:hypothetical protein